MSYAVYHCEKGNISSGGIGNHIDRKIGAEHTYLHADPNKKDLNQSFNLNRYCSMPLHQAIEERIKEGYKGKKAIRKDAVKYTTHILTGSHETMKEIERNPEQLKNWVTENKKFLEQEFGKDNIVRFVLHRDEKTPHLHAVTINLTSDGRLSAKEIIGNRKVMQERQDRYAQTMQSFGLERGIRNTGIKHETAREYYARIEEANKINDNKRELIVEKSILGLKWATFGIDKDKTIENLQNAVKSQKTALKSKERDVQIVKEDLKKISESKTEHIKTIKNMEKIIDKNLVDDKYRFELREQRTRELGRMYAWDVKQKFPFISDSIKYKNDEDIGEMVINAVKKVVEEKNLSAYQYKLLINSKEINEVYNYLIKERENRNELDQNRGRDRGR